ncbi:MAG: rod shape-determining protein MreC [Spirochaetaceae bacterium]|jgi:rod shape-determining protein MreC|nr:rod shape-determining protein MreC [Spirochaetaceae bacterium]
MKLGGQRKKRRRFNVDIYVFAVLSLFSFALLFFSTLSFVVNFKNMGLSIFSGIRGGIYGVSSRAAQTVNSIQELAALQKAYAELTERVTRYEQLERSAAEIRQENYRLREQLGFSQQIRYRHYPAEIIGRDPDNLFSAFVINKGRRDGVAYNMAVITFQDGIQALAGKVIQAGQFESLVMPVYDASSFVPARFASSRYEGLVEGQGRGEYPLLMRLISKRARDEVHFGDMVITSGIGGGYGAVYPAGINIGRVSRIFYKEDETSMEVELETVLDFSRLEYVFVIDAALPDPGLYEAADTFGDTEGEGAGND